MVDTGNARKYSDSTTIVKDSQQGEIRMQKKDDLVQKLIGQIITQTILRRFEDSSETALIVKGFSEEGRFIFGCDIKRIREKGL